jgi:hypothetical protein
MRWECSECGSVTSNVHKPIHCVECGMAGVIFVPADGYDETELDEESLRGAWVRAGFLAADQMV